MKSVVPFKKFLVGKKSQQKSAKMTLKPIVKCIETILLGTDHLWIKVVSVFLRTLVPKIHISFGCHADLLPERSL